MKSKLVEKIEALCDSRSSFARECPLEVMRSILADVQELERQLADPASTYEASYEQGYIDGQDSDAIRQAKREAYEHALQIVDDNFTRSESVFHLERALAALDIEMPAYARPEDDEPASIYCDSCGRPLSNRPGSHAGCHDVEKE